MTIEILTPFDPWIAGAKNPEIIVTFSLDEGEDLTGSSVFLFLKRPDDTLEKTLTVVELITGQHGVFKVDWAATDLIAGIGQFATFVFQDASGDRDLIDQFNIDVVTNPDPTP